MANPVILYQTALQTDALAAGMQQKKWKLPPESGSVQFAAYALDQNYSQRIDQFPPAPKNTPSNASPFSLNQANAILTDLSEPQNIGGALGNFTATFQIVPATWNDIKEMPYTFPGFPGLLGSVGSRNIRTDTVKCRLQYDYFVLDPDNIISAATSGGGAVNATSLLDSGGNAVKCVYGMTDIPEIAKSYFVVNFASTPDLTNRTNSLIPVGGKTVNSTTWIQTLPQLATYQGWIANALANGWSSTVWGGPTNPVGTSDDIGTIGQLVADDSKTMPFAGNIIGRVTIFVLAS